MNTFPVLIPDDDNGSNDSSSGIHPQRSKLTSDHQSYYWTDSNVGSLDQYKRTLWELEILRETNGKCSKCGIQTHYVERLGSSSDRQVCLPLTIPNEVYRGRCLLCHPLPHGSTIYQQQQSHVYEEATNVQTVPKKEPVNVSAPSSNSSWTFSNMIELDSEVETLVCLLQRFPHDENVQVSGCQELWIQSWDDETAQRIVQLGGIDCVLEAMMYFPYNASLQRSGCATLQNLSCVGTFSSAAIVERGGAALIVQAMMRHIGSISIQRGGCCALAAIVASSNELKQDILKSGGGIALVRSMEVHHGEEEFKREAMQTLQMLFGFANGPC